MKLKSLLFSLLIAALTSSAFAQVKIGANPGTIGATSNLEVEATSGQKVIVNKSDGTVVIQNTPSGATTDSLMSIDASGNVRKINKNKVATTVAPQVPYFVASGVISKNSQQPATVTYATGLTQRLNNGRVSYNAAGGTIIIQEAGLYFFGLNTEGAYNTVGDGNGSTNAPKTNDHCAGVYKNGSLLFRTCGRSTALYINTTNSYGIAGSPSSVTSGVSFFNVGDVLTMGLTTASDISFTGQYTINFNLYQLSN